MTVNKVILIGNLGQKPELRTSGGGLSISKLRLATSDRRKGSDGQWNDATEWHTVVVFGSQAENCVKFLDKGRQVYIEGRLQTNKWQDKEGKDRRTTEIIANQVKFLSNKSSSDNHQSSSSNYRSNESNFKSNDSNFKSNDLSNANDEIPF